jgi:hypothetical protein
VKLALVALAAAALTPAPYGATVKLTNADNGRHVRVHRGQRISVVLAVDPKQDPEPTTWWHSISEQGAALSVRPQTWMPVRGVTMGRFKAVVRGEATVSSARAVCPSSPNRPICHAVQGWSVVIDVR